MVVEGCQFQGSSSCRRRTGWSAIRSRTSASQACGSRLLSLADQRVHGRGALATAVRAAEQPGLSAQGDTAQRSFGRVVRETNSPVVEKAGEGWPALEHVVHRFGDFGMARETWSLAAQPVFERRDQRLDVLLTPGKTPLGGLTVDHGFLGEDGVDPAYRFERQGSRDPARSRQIPCW